MPRTGPPTQLGKMALYWWIVIVQNQHLSMLENVLRHPTSCSKIMGRTSAMTSSSGIMASYRVAIVQNQHLVVLAGILGLHHHMLYAHVQYLCHDSELE